MILYRPSLSARFRLTPEFAVEALQGESNVGVQMLLELQDRSGPNDYYAAADRSLQHLDPRTLPGPGGDAESAGPAALQPADVVELLPPPGCSFLHEWIFLLDAKTTDAYGWQYKSEMIATTDGTSSSSSSSSAAAAAAAGSSTSFSASSSFEEGGSGGGGGGSSVWTPSPSHRCTARRRVWFRVYCTTPRAGVAKKKLSDEIALRCRGGECLRGELWKEGQLNRSWKKRYFILTDKSLDYYSGQPSVINKQGSMPLVNGLTVTKLYGQQCPGRSFGFILTAGTGTGRSLLLDAYSEHERSDWVFHLSYVLALLSPNLTFSPLPTSPPFRDQPDEEVVLFRGDLSKQGHVVTNWTTRHFELTRDELRYFDGCRIKGRVPLLDATLTDLSDNAATSSSSNTTSSSSGSRQARADSSLPLEFTLTSRSGYLLRMRAPTHAVKEEWLHELTAVIAMQTTGGEPPSRGSVRQSQSQSQSLEDSAQPQAQRSSVAATGTDGGTVLDSAAPLVAKGGEGRDRRQSTALLAWLAVLAVLAAAGYQLYLRGALGG